MHTDKSQSHIKSLCRKGSYSNYIKHEPQREILNTTMKYFLLKAYCQFISHFSQFPRGQGKNKTDNPAIPNLLRLSFFAHLAICFFLSPQEQFIIHGKRTRLCVEFGV